MPDWRVDVTGELIIERGAIALTENTADETKQNLLFRLQTSFLDYQPNPDLGIGLDLFIGQPSNRSLGAQIEEAIIRSLTRDSLFPADALRVDVVPLDGAHEVGIYIFVVPPAAGEFTAVSVAVTLNLIAGTITPITG